MLENKKLVIFIDTSFLYSVSFRQDSDWQKTLKYSKDKKVMVYISSIVCEEWRTQARDVVVHAIKQSKQSLNALHRNWNYSLSLKGRPNNENKKVQKSLKTLLNN